MSKINLFSFAATALILSLAILTITSAQEHNFDGAREIIESKIPCSQLSDAQFEMIGDYYMEQMHPGELHEIMDERLGGEGSAQLRNTHILLGRSFYCADGSMPTSMMSMMMGNYYYGPYFNLTSILLNILLVLLIIAAVIWLVKLTQKRQKRK